LRDVGADEGAHPPAGRGEAGEVAAIGGGGGDEGEERHADVGPPAGDHVIVAHPGLAGPERHRVAHEAEALGDAGGINPTSGDPRQVYVIRNGAAGNPQIFHLDARTAVAYALAEGFELKARDVVFVDPVPLVSWNRVISLILPSASAVILTRDTADAVSP
jgi:hypothetical protein